MRTWERVTFVATCGTCRTVLGEGMVMQVLTLPNVKRRMIRCEDCADGEPPPDLPAHQVKHQTTKRMQQIAKAIPEWMPYRD